MCLSFPSPCCLPPALRPERRCTNPSRRAIPRIIFGSSADPAYFLGLQISSFHELTSALLSCATHSFRVVLVDHRSSLRVLAHIDPRYSLPPQRYQRGRGFIMITLSRSSFPRTWGMTQSLYTSAIHQLLLSPPFPNRMSPSLPRTLTYNIWRSKCRPWIIPLYPPFVRKGSRFSS